MSERVRWDSLGKIGETVAHFENPPLLTDAATVIRERLVTAAAIVPAEGQDDVDFREYEDAFRYPEQVYKCLMGSAPEEPDVIVGFTRERPMEVRCTWQRTNRWPDSGRDITQETTVMFFRADDNPRFVRHYEEGHMVSPEPLPPSGVFVNFQATESDEPLLRLYGIVRRAGQRPLRLSGYCLDDRIFHTTAGSGNRFGLSVSTNAILKPAEQTLMPAFFLNDIPTSRIRNNH